MYGVYLRLSALILGGKSARKIIRSYEFNGGMFQLFTDPISKTSTGLRGTLML
jgi:hypothetical protein